MRRRLPLLFLLLGSAGFAYLVARIGPSRLIDDATATGWLFLPIVASYAVVYLCNASAWRLLLADGGARIPFGRLYAITVAGFGLNAVTPIVPAGGEAFRVASLAPWVGSRRAACATVSFFLVHALGSLAIWATGITGAMLLRRDDPLVLGLGSALLVTLAAISWILLGGQRHGVVARVVRLARRLPLPARAGAALEGWQEGAAALDRELTGLYHESPRRFLLCVGLDYLGRCVGFIEYWLACVGAGLHIGYGHALVIGALASMGGNLFFWIPFELGGKEGVLYSIFQLFGADPAVGVYASVVTRVREVCWVLIAVVLTWVAASRQPETA
jgi:hypothetical protein